MSAFVPGLGQIKNNKVWKYHNLFVIGTCTYFFVKNNNDFNKYSSEYFRRKNNENNILISSLTSATIIYLHFTITTEKSEILTPY